MSLFINGIDRTPVNSLALLNAASGNEVANRMDYTVNKTAGNDTGWVINKTDTLSTGTSYIIDAQRNGTSVLTLGHKGKIIETVTLEAATGNEVAHTINYTVNKLTSGNSTGLVINGTLTTAPGTNLLVDIQVAGVSKVFINNSGTLNCAGTIYAGAGTGTFYGSIITPLNDNTNLLLNNKNYNISYTATSLTSSTFSGAGVIQRAVAITPTYNQTTTSSATDLLINRTETAVGSGAQLLIDTQVGSVSRYSIPNTGRVRYSPIDNAASPVLPTNPLKFFGYNASKADDAVITCPAITTSAYGVVILGDAEEYARFIINSTGTVTLLDNSANVVANADTDTKLCIGTAATQEPLQIKNRLGGVKVLNVMIWYD